MCFCCYLRVLACISTGVVWCGECVLCDEAIPQSDLCVQKCVTNMQAYRSEGSAAADSAEIEQRLLLATKYFFFILIYVPTFTLLPRKCSSLNI